MEMAPSFEKHTWAEIDLDALTHNFALLRRQAGALPLCAVVKADAYGHGAVACARTLARAGAAWLAVSCLTEALELRRAGLTLPILILGHTQPAFAGQLIAHHITQACFSSDYAAALSAAAVAAGGRVEVHLKADTGMGRLGFALRTDFDGALREMLAVYDLPGLAVTGLFQHFSVADSDTADDITYTADQQALFLRAWQALAAAGHAPALVHCDNSAGLLLHPEWPAGLPRAACMARPGIVLYGYSPSAQVRMEGLRPVMRFLTLVSQVKTMQPGQCASYGRRFTAAAPTRVATLCAGYADGYPRLLSEGRGVVELHGKPARVLGRVCMDQTLVDVTGIPDVRPGDEAVLWGGAASDSAETIADKTGTIPYEVLCGVARRVPRVFCRGGAAVGVTGLMDGAPGPDDLPGI